MAMMYQPAERPNNTRKEHHLNENTSQSCLPLEEALNTLCSWISDKPPGRGLCFRLKLSTFASPYFSQALNAVDPDTWDFHYDPESQVFKLIPLPRAVHESFDWFLRDTLAYEYAMVNTRRETAPPGLWRSRTPNDGIYSAVVFGNKRVEPLIPTVVVEVGFSQSYEDLVLDARQWLLRSTRPPNVVILVKIEEGIASLRSHKCTIAYQSRLKTLLLQHCDAYALASADLDGTGAPEINVDVLREQIVIEDWVENLRVFIEVWVRSSAESDNICSRGARCHILPVPETPTDPVLYITDLIPDQHQQRFQPFDRNRQLTLDMKDFESVFPDS